MYIGRGSVFGNPFEIGNDGSRAEVIEKYRNWLDSQPEVIELFINELKDKDLVCFCKPAACHGDILLHLANPDLASPDNALF